uniref:Uncharacterized protein n=1 Tax=Oryza glumipatula TaxID=40148 RepID=A0A0D9YA88_9ORYZ
MKKGKWVNDPRGENLFRLDSQKRPVDSRDVRDGKEEELAKKCYKCGKKGKSSHISTNCPDLNKEEGLKLCGDGMLGQVFHCLHIAISDEEVMKQPVVGLLALESGVCSESKIVAELKYLLEQHQQWDWKEVWVRAKGVPSIARSEKIMMKIAHLIGDPVEVDAISLIRETVRVKRELSSPSHQKTPNLDIRKTSEGENKTMMVKIMIVKRSS